MELIRIGICDDETYFRDEIEKLVSVYANEAEHTVDIRTFANAEELVEDILDKGTEYHVLFLDVEMEGMTGMDAAKKLRAEGYKGIICFVTSKSHYAYDAFGVDAIGYVTKPAKYTDVKQTMKKAVIILDMQRDEEEAKKRYIEITTQNEKVMLDLHQVIYVEKRRNQCVIHMEESEIVCYETLKSLFERLDKSKFTFTHQGFIVNFDKIKEVKKDTVCFGKGREIPVSRRYQAQLRERHMNKIQRLRKERINH